MTLTRAVSAGTLVGAAAALAIYAVAGPEDLGRVRTRRADVCAGPDAHGHPAVADCVAPAVLEKGVCVTTTPGAGRRRAGPDPARAGHDAAEHAHHHRRRPGRAGRGR